MGYEILSYFPFTVFGTFLNKPLSLDSVILVNFNGEEKEVNIVWGYNIKSVTPLESTPPPGLAEAVDSIFRKEQVLLTL